MRTAILLVAVVASAQAFVSPIHINEFVLAPWRFAPQHIVRRPARKFQPPDLREARRDADGPDSEGGNDNNSAPATAAVGGVGVVAAGTAVRTAATAGAGAALGTAATTATTTTATTTAATTAAGGAQAGIMAAGTAARTAATAGAALGTAATTATTTTATTTAATTAAGTVARSAASIAAGNAARTAATGACIVSSVTLNPRLQTPTLKP
jgi:hypothetical protein